MGIRRRRKTRRPPMLGPSLADVQAAKKPEPPKRPEPAPPLKRPTIGDVMITKEEQ